MKKRAISLFAVLSLSFTFFYPSLSLNDNTVKAKEKTVLEESLEKNEDTGKWIYVDNGQEISLKNLLKAKKGEKEFTLKFWEWISEICR